MTTVKPEQLGKFLRQIKYKIRSAIADGSAKAMKDGISFGFEQNMATGNTFSEWNNTAVMESVADVRRVIVGRFSSPAPVLLQFGETVLSQYGYPKFEYIPDWVSVKGLWQRFPSGVVRVGGQGTHFGRPINRWFDYATFYTKDNLQEYGREELRKINV